MSTIHHPTIGDAVTLEFITTSAYALLIILGTGQPGSLFGASVESWIDFSAPTVRILLALVPVPDSAAGGAHSDAAWVYRHILAACIIIACGHFICSCRHWRSWSEHLSGFLSAASGCVEKRRSIALLSYRRMVLGLAAAMFLVLFAESQMPFIDDFLFHASWTYVRAPLLLGAAYAFACHAAALRILLNKTR